MRDQQELALAAQKRITALKNVLSSLPESIGSGGAPPLNPSAIYVLDHSLAVLGSPERLTLWMQTPVASLGGRTPWSLLDTAEGRNDVETTLGRIAHGVY